MGFYEEAPKMFPSLINNFAMRKAAIKSYNFSILGLISICCVIFSNVPSAAAAIT
jgi:hypothetical protein